jgi:HTH-type transcriptional regulator/antitoxin MqsA
MSAVPDLKPTTMVSPETGATLVRDVRPLTVTYRGESVTVDAPGYYPAEGDSDDGVLIGDDLAVTDAALRILKERVHGIPTPDRIRSFRERLGLSLADAGLVFGVGETAFEAYESGVDAPAGPTIQLLRLLERHPDLLDELR